MGKVFGGEKKRIRTPVAMKFFGYTRLLPTASCVATEIELMRSLVGIEGVIQILDVFMDTPKGLIPGRKSAGPFPVIVMELMAGSDLFDRINTRTVVSERSLSILFKSVSIAVNSLHLRRFVHRDLKPENLMLTVDAEDSPVKLIDFGK
jgi:calcium-dependent protein kinase